MKPKGAICLIQRPVSMSELTAFKAFKPQRVYVKFAKAPKRPNEKVFAYFPKGIIQLLARTADFVPDAAYLEEFDWFCLKFVLVWDEKTDLRFNKNDEPHHAFASEDRKLRR